VAARVLDVAEPDEEPPEEDDDDAEDFAAAGLSDDSGLLFDSPELRSGARLSVR
jgi:hypothetical protein